MVTKIFPGEYPRTPQGPSARFARLRIGPSEDILLDPPLVMSRHQVVNLILNVKKADCLISAIQSSDARAESMFDFRNSLLVCLFVCLFLVCLFTCVSPCFAALNIRIVCYGALCLQVASEVSLQFLVKG